MQRPAFRIVPGCRSLQHSPSWLSEGGQDDYTAFARCQFPPMHSFDPAYSVSFLMQRLHMLFSISGTLAQL